MIRKSSGSTYGWFLVGAQLCLIAVLVVQIYLADPLRLGWVGAIGGTLVLAGLALLATTQYFNRPGNWSVHPLPRRDGQLITGGPYAVIRHPMYTAVLLTAVGATGLALSTASVLCTLALGVVLVLKINIEEREMAAKFPGWEQYVTRTKRLVPKLW